MRKLEGKGLRCRRRPLSFFFCSCTLTIHRPGRWLNEVTLRHDSHRLAAVPQRIKRMHFVTIWRTEGFAEPITVLVSLHNNSLDLRNMYLHDTCNIHITCTGIKVASYRIGSRDTTFSNEQWPAENPRLIAGKRRKDI